MANLNKLYMANENKLYIQFLDWIIIHINKHNSPLQKHKNSTVTFRWEIPSTSPAK